MRQLGGRSLALATLHSFLHARSIGYRGGISSPLSAPDACSRISAYLTYGCISMREVVQSTRQHLEHLPSQPSRHRAGLSAFVSRLYWHCHFIQKLESEPEIEWRNMHRGYDNLREQDFNQEYFEALKEARTGWPMVDACVTMLRETGWLNFRMRAMLVSVAATPVVTLASCGRMVSNTVLRLRTRHSLESDANAVWNHWHQHYAGVQPYQASARP
jgi:deoxyribodipyrimidine photo-lyase